MIFNPIEQVTSILNAFTFKSLAIFVLNLKRTNEERASSYPLYSDDKEPTKF